MNVIIKRTGFASLVLTYGLLLIPTANAKNITKAKAPISDQATQQNNSDQPIRIVADEMDCDQKTNICTAKGNAFAQKMNDPKNQTISAATLIAHFEKSDKKSEKKTTKGSPESNSSSDKSQGISRHTSLKKIEAIGDVVMADTSSIIKCDRGIYYADSETADLYDNVSLTQGKNELTGTHGHANMKDETYTIKNENGRVEGLFYQKDKPAA